MAYDYVRERRSLPNSLPWKVYRNEGDMEATAEEALMKHWQMFNKQMVKSICY